VWSNPECACMGKSISSHELISNFDQKILWVYILSVLISVNLPPSSSCSAFVFSIFWYEKVSKNFKKIRGKKNLKFTLENKKIPKLPNFLSIQQQIFVLKNFCSLSIDASPIDVPQEEGNRRASTTHLFCHQKLPQIMKSFSTELTSFSFFINFKFLSKG